MARPLVVVASVAWWCAASSPLLAQVCTPLWSVPPANQRPTGTIRQLVQHGNTIVARGDGLGFGTQTGLGIAQYDGLTWKPLTAGLDGSNFGAAEHPPSLVSWQGQLFITGRGTTPFSNNGRIWNGSTWTDWPTTPAPSPFATTPLSLFTLPDGRLIAGGTFTFEPDPDTGGFVNRRLAEWNGSRWQVLSASSYGPASTFTGNLINDLLWYDGKLLVRFIGNLATGPRFNSDVVPCPNGLATFDGSTFTPFNAPQLNGSITSSAVFNGELYVGGDFTGAQGSGVVLNRLARYSNGQWLKVGNGLSQQAAFMKVLDDGTGPKLHIFGSGSNLFAYNDPNSTTNDTVNYRGVVRFDGSRFSAYGAALSSGFTRTVYAAINFDPGTGNAVFAGGADFFPGNIAATNFARFGPAESPDTDGDAIPDSWELNGLDINCDGTLDLDLPAMGAHWLRKDVFVEVDSMDFLDPDPATLQRVVNAFNAVPNTLVLNPNGQDGIKLHLIIDAADQSIPFQEFPNAWPEFHAIKESRFGNASDRASPNAEHIRAAKAQVFRYCLFADSFMDTSYSGIAEIGGNDFMVTLGRWNVPGGTPDEQAATFMHELGHTLGLYHGGHQTDENRFNYKPNYHSIMNYSWQVSSDRPGWTLDYSRQALPTLNEANLDEISSLGGAPGTFTLAGPPPVVTISELGSVDWNRNGLFELGVTVDVNRIVDAYPTSFDVLEGSVDWLRLVYNFRNSPDFANGVSTNTTLDVDRMTPELAQYLRELAGTSCPADLNADGVVDDIDFVLFAQQYNLFDCADPAMPAGCPADLNRDSQVDDIDFVLFAQAYDAFVCS